ncbi:redox-sensing transcriptional repressor [Desulfitispora alkaliphila]|uniref:redox-sensing transcriptional repressor Rex n=1 Tax=Desulfitispora alkaliphila TaxID=622674 RepID=UPI003D20D452
MKTYKIPEASIIRLSVYSRYLNQLDNKGVLTISSGEIAEGVGVSPAQVRKDLAYFGEFGTRGVGYNVKDLNRHMMKILGLNKAWKIVIVGAGNLGKALSFYKGFHERGLSVVGLFDKNTDLIGEMVGNNRVMCIGELEQFVREEQVDIGVIAVPSKYAQETADVLVEAGIKAILNFAPKALVDVPNTVELRNVDLAVNLEILTFNMGMKEE